MAFASSATASLWSASATRRARARQRSEQAEAILTESPGWPWLHHLRSLCLEKTGRLADALLAEQAAFDLLPTSPGIQNRLQDLRAATENLQAQEPD